MITLFFMLLFAILGIILHPSWFLVTGLFFIIDIIIYFIYRSQQTNYDYWIKLKIKDTAKLSSISPENWHYGYYKSGYFDENTFLSVWYISPSYWDEKNKYISKKKFHVLFSYFGWKRFYIWAIYQDHLNTKKQKKQTTIEFLQACQKDVDKKYKEATALIEKGTKQMKKVIKYE